jgi:hypothetical protein
MTPTGVHLPGKLTLRREPRHGRPAVLHPRVRTTSSWPCYTITSARSRFHFYDRQGPYSAANVPRSWPGSG